VTKLEVRDAVEKLAREIQTEPAKYAQCTAGVLLSLAGALSCDEEYLFFKHSIEYAKQSVVRCQAKMN